MTSTRMASRHRRLHTPRPQWKACDCGAATRSRGRRGNPRRRPGCGCAGVAPATASGRSRRRRGRAHLHHEGASLPWRPARLYLSIAMQHRAIAGGEDGGRWLHSVGSHDECCSVSCSGRRHRRRRLWCDFSTTTEEGPSSMLHAATPAIACRGPSNGHVGGFFFVRVRSSSCCWCVCVYVCVCV